MNFWQTVMAVASRGGGAAAVVARQFTILPTVSGLSTWDLDVNGPCTLVAADSPYVFTAIGTWACQVELWGPGGGSGGVGATVATSGTNGSASTQFGAIGGMPSAGPGVGSTGATTNGAGAGRVGGSASNGDTNTTGGSGTAGTIAATCIGGNGGAAPNGGAASTGQSAGSGVSLPGVAGNFPGGGAAGAVHGDATGSSRRAVGGGGSGAYCKKTYTALTLPSGAQTLTIGLRGTAGTGDEANGAAGANGSLIIT